MDKNNKEFTLQALTDQEIKTHGFSLSDLWLLRDKNHKLHGPLHTKKIQAKIEENPTFFTDAQICNLDTEIWSPLFQTKEFQRREDQQTNSSHMQGSDFYLHVNGQKTGPHTEEKVREILASGKIGRDCQTSLDEGKTWFKLYEHPHFDRRTNKSNQELPFRPAPEVLNFVDKAKEEILKMKEEEEAIIELAFIGHNKSETEKVEHLKKSTPHAINIPDQVEEAHSKYPINAPKKYMAFASVFVILGFLFFFSSNENMDENLEGETVTKTRSINNSSRNTKRAPASVENKEKLKTPKVKAKKTIVKAKRYVPKVKKNTASSSTRTRRRPIAKNRRNKNNPRLNQDTERLDINDPEFQEEMSRRLAGDYELEEDRDRAPEYENEPPYEDEQDYEDERQNDDYPNDYPDERGPEDDPYPNDMPEDY